MSRAIVAVTLLVASLPADMLACGDKFLVPGRGVRFRHPPVARATATVLLYAPPGSRLNGFPQAPSVEGSLRAAGYRPEVTTSEAAFEKALRDTVWEVVVIDLAEGVTVAGKLPAPAPTVLPVAYGASEAALSDARQRYRRVLDSPTSQRAIVQAVDAVIAEHARARAKSSSRIGG